MVRSPAAQNTRKPAKCPQCGSPVAMEYRPFCSRRCADVDLGNWLGGVYAVASDEPVILAEDGGAFGGDIPSLEDDF